MPMDVHVIMGIPMHVEYTGLLVLALRQEWQLHSSVGLQYDGGDSAEKGGMAGRLARAVVLHKGKQALENNVEDKSPRQD